MGSIRELLQQREGRSGSLRSRHRSKFARPDKVCVSRRRRTGWPVHPSGVMCARGRCSLAHHEDCVHQQSRHPGTRSDRFAQLARALLRGASMKNFALATGFLAVSILWGPIAVAQTSPAPQKLPSSAWPLRSITTEAARVLALVDLTSCAAINDRLIGHALISFTPDGAASSVTVDATSDPGSTSCVQAAFLTARISPFEDRALLRFGKVFEVRGNAPARPPQGRPAFDSLAAANAVDAVDLAPCAAEGRALTGHVVVSFAPDGTVIAVTIPWISRPEAITCVAERLRRVALRPFEGSSARLALDLNRSSAVPRPTPRPPPRAPRQNYLHL